MTKACSDEGVRADLDAARGRQLAPARQLHDEDALGDALELQAALLERLADELGGGHAVSTSSSARWAYTRPPVDAEQLVGGLLPAEHPGVVTGRPGQVLAQGRGADDASHRVRVVRGVVPVDEQAGRTVLDRRGQPAYRRGHHRRPRGLGLDRHQPERLAVRRDADQRRRAVPVGEGLLVDRGHEPDHPVAGPGRRPARPSRRGAPARCRTGRRRSARPAARAATGRAGASARPRGSGCRAPSGAGSGRRRAGRRRRAGARAGDGPRRRHRDGRPRGRPRGAPSPPSPGPRRRGSTSWRASLPVLATSMSALSTTCSSPSTPGGRLRGVPVGEGLVLHLGHRVHGVDQGHLPAVAQQGADLAGEPVVRVHDVVPAPRPGPRGRSRWRAKVHIWPGSSDLGRPS